MHAARTVSFKQAVDAPAADFRHMTIAIIPFPALGDLTIYLRLGWLFHRAGAKVTFYSDALYSAREYFSWLTVLPAGESTLETLAQHFDLLIAYRRRAKNRAWGSALPENVAFISAKKISGDPVLAGQSVTVKGRTFYNACRPFCIDSRRGDTMIACVDEYAREVFGLEPDAGEGFLAHRQEPDNTGLVLVFPTTPEPKKNYWLVGFRLLAWALQRRGWKVEFICTPSEHQSVAASLPGYVVRSFPDIKALMDHVACATVVVSNDSGGGHLGSMMGLATFTITRRKAEFVWRPGFNKRNTVIYPWFRFKWLGKTHIWRPFIPIWRIANQMGARKRP